MVCAVIGPTAHVAQHTAIRRLTPRNKEYHINTRGELLKQSLASRHTAADGIVNSDLDTLLRAATNLLGETMEEVDALCRLRQQIYRAVEVDSGEVIEALNNGDIVIDLSRESYNLGMATLTQEHNTTTYALHLIVGLPEAALKACNNGARSVDNVNAELLGTDVCPRRLAMGTHKKRTTTERSHIVVRDGTQTKLLEALHLDTVMHYIAKRVNLTRGLQSLLSLANGAYDTKAEA